MADRSQKIVALILNKLDCCVLREATHKRTHVVWQKQGWNINVRWMKLLRLVAMCLVAMWKLLRGILMPCLFSFCWPFCQSVFCEKMEKVPKGTRLAWWFYSKVSEAWIMWEIGLRIFILLSFRNPHGHKCVYLLVSVDQLWSRILLFSSR